MADVDTEVKRWGNSLGVRLPRALLKAHGIGPGDRVHVHVEKAAVPQLEAWGIMTRFPRRKGRLPTFEEFRKSEQRRERARERERGYR